MKQLKGEIILFLTALIWGLAFIFQSTASSVLGPFTFNGSRFLLGAISLLPLLRFNRHGINLKKCAFLGGILGLCICIGANLQQYAIAFTSAGKAGFITSLYMIFVPIICMIFYKDKISKWVLLAILMAVGGLYLLCGGSLELTFADIYLIGAALFFALQIIFVDRYTRDVNSVSLSFFQYLSAALVSIIMALFFEDIRFETLFEASGAILYTGILSTGVAYTLQIIGQKYTEPSVASILLSLEAVIAAIAGYLFLNQSLSLSELFGCMLMLGAVLLSQLRPKEKENERS